LKVPAWKKCLWEGRRMVFYGKVRKNFNPLLFGLKTPITTKLMDKNLLILQNAIHVV